MRIWLEFFCEGRSDKDGYDCLTHDNDSPAAECVDIQEKLIETIEFIAKQAVKMGWVKENDGWLCPACSRRRAQAGEGS